MSASPTGDRRCEECLAVLAPTARFCPECGARVAPGSQPENRRTVTLLFSDVTGSTAMGEQLDPEAYRRLMTRYFAVAREAVERHGGQVEKFVGDAVLAVFGVPEVREDDALRAVRAAHDLTAAVAALSAEIERTLGTSLLVRTGVNTGSVVTGAAYAGGSFVTGDAVNTAARLEQAAAPGQVLLGAATLALVRDSVEVGQALAIAAKGKSQPVVAHALISVTDAAEGRVRRPETPLVGRDREAEVLDVTLDRTLESRRGHLVTVLGDPGIGKTRLVDDFVRRIGDRAQVVGGRCVSYGQGITYWPVVQLLRQALGLTGNESEEGTRHVVARLGEGVPDWEQVVELVLPLLGGSGEPGRCDQTSWSVARVLEQLALRRPLVVTVDDLHWAEPTLVELLERVRDEVADLPLLFVCQARPELLDRQPGWGGGSLNSTLFALDPFSTAQTGTSITGLLGGPVPPEVAVAVADWAGGNPLFVEEITAHLVEEGVLVQDDGAGWVLVGDLSQARVPPTVSALIAARLDRLPVAERQLLERVSVVGLELTTYDALALVDDAATVEHLLSVLARRDLLRRTRGRQGDTWAFRHVLVREAAYAALPKELRAELHERFAARLETSASDAGPERVAFVAHHLEAAARLRHEVTPGSPEAIGLAIRAATTLAAAAQEAVDRDDSPAAEGLLRGALTLSGLAPAARRDLMARLNALLLGRGRIADSKALIEEYAATLDDPPAGIDVAYVRAWRLSHALTGAEDVDPADLATAARELADLARAADDLVRLDQALVVAMHGVEMLAQFDELLRLSEEEAGLGGAPARHAESVRPFALMFGTRPMSVTAENTARLAALPGRSRLFRVWMQVYAAMCAAAMATPDSAALVEAAGRAAAALDPADADELTATLAEANLLLGNYPEAITYFERSIARHRRWGGLAFASTDLAQQAGVLLALDAPLDRVREILAEAEAVTSRHDVLSLALVAMGHCVVAAREGDLEEAARRATEAVETVDRGDLSIMRPRIRVVVSEAARLRGDRAEEQRLLGEALELCRAKELHAMSRRIEERLRSL
ncbi:class 3 adenylate cyclase/tetratricopeptide (TPR) repeat protein [Nocardioides ginsengisegetis]|uniref:Class 3 adenylate cyclase/tetratricopeptide (TPR) repeat protein n=1 Tax=Nocardioides ginsengisegetis TaxID=661491 RepID=A0A7W3PA03_9ACTN|nr:adenylate/guanylate cyclase domain-containing protein [Nocardioides ginsengisegetis]MBA8804073.1 class 3 adenylate cyclase/tetratricopeptide (TPR) repeat protein [Nocardioides ginsengisegetis]